MNSRNVTRRVEVSVRTVKFTNTGRCPRISVLGQMVADVPGENQANFVAFCPVLPLVPLHT